MSRLEPPSSARLLASALLRRPLLALLVLLGILYVPWLTAIPLDGTLEGNRLQAAREMLTGGSWVVPRLNGEPYLAKPPMHPWMMALIGWPVGDVCLTIGRGLSVASALATCVLVFLWGRREFGRRSGFFAALAAGGCVLLAEKAMRAELELPLTLWTTAAVLALWEAGHAAGVARRRGYTLVAGLALGAAILVKGPPPLLVFLMAWGGVALRRESRRSFLAPGLLAVAIGLLGALCWVASMTSRLGFDQMWHAFDAQFVQRLSNAGRTNAEPFWFYLPATVVALFPATLAAPALALVRPRSAPAPSHSRTALVFLWSWALLPLVFFSFSSGKEARYLLPTVPAWALLLSLGWTRARTRGRWARWRRGLGRMLSVSSWIAPPAVLLLGITLVPEHTAAIVGSALLAGIARAAFAWKTKRRPALAFAALALFLFAGKWAWAGTALAIKRERIPVAEIARTVLESLGPDEPWILLGPYRSWWHFSIPRPCQSVAKWDDLAEARRVHDARANVLLAPEKLLPPNREALTGLREIGRWMVDGDAYRVLRFEP